MVTLDYSGKTVVVTGAGLPPSPFRLGCFERARQIVDQSIDVLLEFDGRQDGRSCEAPKDRLPGEVYAKLEVGTGKMRQRLFV